MPDFIYRGDEGRVYPSLPAPANGPEVGSTYTLRKDPGDGRWEIVKDSATKAAPKKKTEPPAPAGDNKE